MLPFSVRTQGSLFSIVGGASGSSVICALTRTSRTPAPNVAARWRDRPAPRSPDPAEFRRRASIGRRSSGASANRLARFKAPKIGGVIFLRAAPFVEGNIFGNRSSSALPSLAISRVNRHSSRPRAPRSTMTASPRVPTARPAPRPNREKTVVVARHVLDHTGAGFRPSGVSTSRVKR